MTDLPSREGRTEGYDGISFRTIRRQVERVEDALEPGPEPWTFTLTADDVQQLGWVRVLCDIALGEEPRPRAAGWTNDSQVLYRRCVRYPWWHPYRWLGRWRTIDSEHST